MRRLSEKTDKKYFRQAMGDQMVLLNKNKGAIQRDVAPMEAVEKIKQVVNAAKSSQIWVDCQIVTEEEANLIQSKTGLDVQGYVHYFGEGEKTHSLKEHGAGNENRPDHMPITEDDFLKIPSVINEADSIELSSNKTGTGLNAIVYSKRINGNVYVVEEIRTGRGKLAFKTMYKKAAIGASGATSASAEGVRQTSETFPDQPSKII